MSRKTDIFEAVLTNPYNHNSFVDFVREFLNDMDIVAPTQYKKVYNNFSYYVDGYFHIGNYQGDKEKLLSKDIYRRCKIMADIKYEIIEELGVLSESAKGWKKELNLISWNGAEPKYDLRDWAPNHEKMGKGVTLNEEEVKTLYKILGKIAEQ